MARFTENADNTGRLLKLAEVTAAYAATIAIVPNASKTFVNVAELTGAATINATVTDCVVNDELVFTLLADGTGRTVTFGTGLNASATIAVTADKNATVSFVYNGTTFVETGRAIGA
jgi:hypothetical protein